MEIKFDNVPASVWQKFERMSNDSGRDRTQFFIQLIEKAYAEFKADEKAPKKLKDL